MRIGQLDDTLLVDLLAEAGPSVVGALPDGVFAVVELGEAWVGITSDPESSAQAVASVN